MEIKAMNLTKILRSMVAASSTRCITILLLLFSGGISVSVNALEAQGNAFKLDIPSLKVEGVKADLLDVYKSGDKDKPITCGIFRMGKGNPLEYTYAFDEGKVLLEGDMKITDSTGKVVDLKPGDMVLFSNGDKVSFSSDSGGLAYYCAQR